ncbi:MarR family winged helix-turn-helix transcriptional regulator [Lacrimispora sp. 210928-DFI.3.58]|uniref:MarR family winged helix-turn-helix transcriptional regulator n=1 Tax=Lacrimispora sp. 210928-DFI.3.58 TaxID=2883214 RepID=UPI0015B59786|nr:MarR family transcriptional regulator [Lacrimispora sp. 210928-DFI.3.58]MCB7320202.1 MarR family transcriptional regulator [Lacrimispora sp. 210928-DFI.3.58]
MKANKQSELNRVKESLYDKIDAVYRHSALLQGYSMEIHDYGNGYYMSEVEAHTLLYVCQNDDTTVTQLAKDTFRTKGTVSKMLKKLEDKGLVERRQKDGNKKWVYFVPTEEGLRVNEIHRAYDKKETLHMIEALLEDCTLEEIENFYKVTEYRIKFLEKKQNEK